VCFAKKRGEAYNRKREQKLCACLERGMEHHQTTLERAFELASSGTCPSVDFLTKKTLEGYDLMQLHGKSLRKQLSQIIEDDEVLVK
jgi:hypothetical protein